ncbi:MAG: NAD(P)H-binding protein [Gammaproteobacteria bacterium]|nr:NAD(P)H-binding protein [Gammaproteobacteria bacterium]
MNHIRRLFLAAAMAVIATAGAGQAAAAKPEPREVLVFGGTGQLGAEIVRRLLVQGDRVTVFTRPGSDRSRLTGLAVGYVEGDLLNEADVTAAFAGKPFRYVIVAVRVEDADPHFYAKFLPGLTARAKAAGVVQLIHHGAVGAGRNAEKFQDLGWEKVPGLLDRLKDQGVGEDIVRASGVPWTIIRNTRLYPDGTPPTGKAELTEDDSVIGPMTRADLAVLTLRCLGNAGCLGRTWHVRDPSLAWPPPKAPGPESPVGAAAGK